MRKSSLGKRRTGSVRPLTSISGMQEIPEPKSVKLGRASSGDRQTNAAKSFIPRPTIGRSTSAERCVNTPITPMTCATPCSSSSVMRMRVQSKPVKDMRPLADKNFQNLAVHKIIQYFKLCNDTDMIVNGTKALSSRSLTLKIFVDMVAFLLANFFPKEEINMSKYTEKIPHLAKLLCYPNVVKKSWLLTANSSHSWPQVIGLLSWLVDTATICHPDVLTQVMFQHADDEEEVDKYAPDSERMLKYYLACYQKFNSQVSDKDEEEQLLQEMTDKLNINDRDFEALQREMEQIQQLKQNPEMLMKLAKFKELQEIKTRLQNDMHTMEQSIQSKVTLCSREEQKIEELERGLARQEHVLEKRTEDLLHVSQQLKSQKCSVEDIQLKEQEVRELEEALALGEESLETLKKEVYVKDLETANLRTQLNKLSTDHDAFISKHVDALPELHDLKIQHINYLHKDAMLHEKDMDQRRTEILAKLLSEKQKVEAAQEENEELQHEQKKQELKEAVRKVIEKEMTLKHELALLNKSLTKQEELAFEKLQQIEQEKADLKANMPDPSKLLLELEKMQENISKVTAKIQVLDEEARSFFAEIGEIDKQFVHQMIEIKQPLLDLLRSKGMTVKSPAIS